MIKNPRTRRRLSLGLLALGGLLLLLAPENAWLGLILFGIAALLEVIGVYIGHSENP